MKLIKPIAALLVILALSGCSSAAKERVIYDAAMSMVSARQAEVSAYLADIGGYDAAEDADDYTVSGKADLTVMVLDDFSGVHMRKLIADFMAENPGITINYKPCSYSDVGSTGFIAGLLADMPDVFDTSHFSNPKLVEKNLFCDLNTFIDGTNGINRANLFDNIVRACEADGALYHVPIYFNYFLLLPNKLYMQEIGVDASELITIDIEQKLDLYSRVSALHPDDTIYIDQTTHIMNVFTDEWTSMVNLVNKKVDVNTPKTKELLTAIRDVPTRVSLLPDGVRYSGASESINTDLFSPNDNLLFYRNGFSIDIPYLFYILDNPTMKYANPVMSATIDGNIPFERILTLSITQKCANKELAWKFVKFCINSTENYYEEFTDVYNYLANACLPVNRDTFDAQIRPNLADAYDLCVARKLLEKNDDEAIAAAAREDAIDGALKTYIRFAEACNTENKVDYIATGYLVYPDLYLYYTGRQDVNRTLVNIQSRLVLYVNE